MGNVQTSDGFEMGLDGLGQVRDECGFRRRPPAVFFVKQRYRGWGAAASSVSLPPQETFNYKYVRTKKRQGAIGANLLRDALKQNQKSKNKSTMGGIQWRFTCRSP